MTTAELAVGALRAAIEETDFRSVLDAIEEIRSEREEALAEALEEYEMAERRLDRATSSADMRTWSEEEADEYHGAQFAASEAWQKLKKAREAM